MLSGLTEFSLRWPRLTIGMAVLISVSGAWLASRAPSSSGAHALIGADHAAVRELEAFLEEFDGGYPVVVAWSCERSTDPCASALDAPSLEMAHAVGEALARSPLVRRISSPAHTPLLQQTADGMVARRLVSDGKANVSDELAALARADHQWLRALISADARVGAIIVESMSTRPEEQVELIETIEASLAPHRERGFRFALSGNSMFHVASQRDAMAETVLIGAATGTVIAICFFFLLGSWQSVAGVLLTVGLATGCGLGVIPAFAWPWDPLTSAAPTMILVMGCADAMHYLTCYWRLRSAHVERKPALIAASRETIVPCSMTTATSVAGLSSFAGVASVGFAHFGAVTSAGVAASLLFTFTLLPALLSQLPDTSRFAVRESARWEGIVDRLVEFPIRNRRSVLLGSAIATLVGAAGLTSLTTDAHPLSYWKEGHPTRAAIEFVSNRLTSIEGVELRLGLPSAFEDAEAYEALDRFEESLSAIAGIRQVRSINDVLDQSAQALGFEHLDGTGAAEVLTLISLGNEASLTPWISLDHRALRVSVSADPLGVSAREQLLSRIDASLGTLPGAWSVVVTGPSVLQSAIDSVVRSSALQSFSVASLLVTILVMAFLRSVGAGLLAMIPNLVPMIVLFGLMGFFGIALDAGTALVAPISIGIAVDDTIHFLHVYSAERRSGVASIDAARKAGRLVGRAVVATSGTLALGFLAMLVSRFQSMSNIGVLSAAAIVAAFAAELLVLPALISTASREATAVEREVNV